MNRSLVGLVASALLIIGLGSCSKTNVGTNPDVPGSSLPKDCGFYPKAGSVFTYRCEDAKGVTSSVADSITGIQLGDSLGPRLTAVTGKLVNYGVYFPANGDPWVKEAYESGVYKWNARLGACSMQSFPCTTQGESANHHTAGNPPTSYMVTRKAGTTYLGEESLVVGSETLKCEHVQAWQDYTVNWDDGYRDTTYSGTVHREYWFSRSLGYFVKVIAPSYRDDPPATVTLTLTGYKLVR